MGKENKMTVREDDRERIPVGWGLEHHIVRSLMGQPQTEHTTFCMLEEKPLPAWKTYKRRMKDECSREKSSTPRD